MRSNFLVRRLRLADLDRILEIEHACFRKDAYSRKLFAEYARECGEYFLVARRGAGVAPSGGGVATRPGEGLAVRDADAAVRSGGMICGYILTCPCRGGAELVSVAVDPVARGEGAASALMDSTLRRLKQHGAARLTLTVRVTNRTALRFYKKYGFEKVKMVRGYYEDGQDGWRMAKLL